MRTRPPKNKRESATIGGLSRKEFPAPRIGTLTEAFADPAKVKQSILNAMRWPGPDAGGEWARFVLGNSPSAREAYRRAVLADERYTPSSWSNRLHIAPDEPPVVFYTAPGDWTPKPPPPLALNLNLSAGVPTLEEM